MLRSNNRYEDTPPRDGMSTWAQRIAWLRQRGVEGPDLCGLWYFYKGAACGSQSSRRGRRLHRYRVDAALGE